MAVSFWKEGWRQNAARARMTSLPRLAFSLIFWGIYWVSGEASLIILMSVNLTLTLTFFCLLWLPVVSDKWEHVATAATARPFGYFRSLLDTIQVGILLHATGGLDSPFLIGFAIPVVFSSFGVDRYRGVATAIVAVFLGISSEISTSFGILPDRNLWSTRATPTAPVQIAVEGICATIALLSMSIIANKVYRGSEAARSAAELERQAADEMREAANAARAQADTLRLLAAKAATKSSLADMVDTVLDFIERTFGLSYFGFYLVDEPGEYLIHYRSRQGSDVAPGVLDFLRSTSIPLDKNASVVAAALLRGRTLFLPRMPKVSRSLDEELTSFAGIGSILVVPMWVEGKPIGVLIASQYQKELKLTREQINNLETLCGQVAGMIRTTRLLEQTAEARAQADRSARLIEKSRKELEKLNELSKQVNRTSDLNYIVAQIFSYMADAYGFDGFILMLQDVSAKPELYVSRYSDAVRGPDAHIYAGDLRIPLSGDGGLFERAFGRRTPILVPDTQTNILRTPYPGIERDREVIEQLGLRGFLILPLVVQGESTALIVCASSTPLVLKKQMRSSIRRLADQMAGVVHTSNLLDHVKRERDRAEIASARAETARLQMEVLAEETAILAELARKANEAPDLARLTLHVSEVIKKRYGSGQLALYAVAPNEQKLVLQAGVDGMTLAVPEDYSSLLREIPLVPESGSLFHTFKKAKTAYFPKTRRSLLARSPVDLAGWERWKFPWFLQLPLIIEGAVVGILVISGLPAEATEISREAGATLKRSDLDFCERMAAQVAGAVRAAVLLEQTEIARKESEKARQKSEILAEETAILADLARRANQGRSIDGILTNLFDVIEKRFSANTMGLFTVDTTSNVLIQRSGFYQGKHLALTDYPEKIQVVPLKAESGMLYRTYMKRKIFYLPRINHEWLAKSPVDEAIVKSFSVAWVLHAPLIVDEQVIAILAIAGAVEGDRFNKDDLDFVERVASQVAGAVRAAMLLQQTELARAEAEKATQETEILAELARHANEASDLDQLIGHVHEVVRQRYGAGQLGLYARDRNANKLVLRGGFVGGEMSRASEYDLIVREVPLIESSGSLFHAFTKGEPVYFSDVRRLISRFSAVDRAVWNTWKFSWLVELPLKIENEVVGILVFCDMPVDDQETVQTKTQARLKRADIDFCERIAAQVAGAVRSAELLHQADEARAESDKLLSNILPASVAQELKREGRVEPLFYDAVSVLFTDFVGFTQASQNMLPDELVSELDGCFSQFDEVVKRNNMEKLKTIGDAYMCAAGIPALNHTHAIDACLTALEFRSFMAQMAQIKETLGQPFWELRIGIHSGPVTAGVVGTSKFAYDIWGDTVNTASRMESSGSPGKINISGDTYALVKEFFDCEYRGKVQAKGKGEMDMYFLKSIKRELSADALGLLPNGRFEILRTNLVPQS